MKYNDTWDLESIFPGGTKSKELKEKLKTISKEVKEYETLLNEWDTESEKSAITLKDILHKQEIIAKGLGQARTFVQMGHDAFMDDEYANVAMGQVVELYSEVAKQLNRFGKKLVTISDNDWDELLQDEQLRKTSFVLNEKRDKGKRLLSEAEEKIIAELNKDGITAWSQIYDTTVSIMAIPFTDKDGKSTELSVGQAMNRMYAEPDPEIRKQIFDNWEKAWTHYGPIFADILNHLSGYRLTLQKAHNREGHLDEPLECNRMSKETLHAMWGAVQNNKQPFLDYLQQKAKLFGMEKLGWQDVDAPVAIGNVEPTTFTYDEACDFVIDRKSVV